MSEDDPRHFDGDSVTVRELIRVLDSCGSCVFVRDERLILKVFAVFATREGVRLPLASANSKAFSVQRTPDVHEF
jgi:hypothetical protein